MIALVVTLFVTLPAGFALAALLRMPLPPARFAFAFLAGVGANGAVLYVLGALGVPLTLVTFAAVPLVSLAYVPIARKRLVPLRIERPRRHALASIVFAIPLLVLFLAAAVMPARDYDGRVTWLPKARAIALERSVAGPFFHGERGLNLHNRYPLLLPLDAAAVMRLTGDTRNETARWMYVLIPIAALVVLRSMLAAWCGAAGAWIAAAVAWLPVLASLEGGALAAYNDLALMAFAGTAVLYLVASLDDGAALRVSGAFAAFAVLAKNEGAALAIAVVIAAFLVRRLPVVVIAPVAAAYALVAYWRTLVPAAYDEQYEVLAASLPRSLHRLPEALLAIVTHAARFAEWGPFWIAVVMAALFARSRGAAIPLVTIAVAVAAYTAALTVTSWNIADLAPVAVNRLLSHLIVPGACAMAMVYSATAGRTRDVRPPARTPASAPSVAARSSGDASTS